MGNCANIPYDEHRTAVDNRILTEFIDKNQE